MFKRYCTGVFVFFFVIAVAGCTSTGPIGMDGRVKNIDDLAERISYKYNQRYYTQNPYYTGQTKVNNAQLVSRHHQHYGDYALTLFNVRATMGDLPDMVDTFQNYCWYLGGVQREHGIRAENPKSFSLICEPKELRELGKYRSRNDPAYYLYFVNVLLTPKFQAEKVAKNADKIKANEYIINRRDAYRSNAHLDNPKVQTTTSRLRNGYYTNGYATHYRHSIGYYANRQHNNGYSTIHPHTHSYYEDSAAKKLLKANPKSTYYPDTNPYNAVAPRTRPGSAGAYCVNFLINENQTYSTPFSKMADFKKNRELFKTVLNKTKAYC